MSILHGLETQSPCSRVALDQVQVVDSPDVGMVSAGLHRGPCGVFSVSDGVLLTLGMTIRALFHKRVCGCQVWEAQKAT